MEDVFDQLLTGIESEDEELNTSESIGVDFNRGTTWAIDWKRGRFAGKVDGNAAVAQRTAKYMLTPRGELPIYPKLQSVAGVAEDYYGSFLHTMIGQVFATTEDLTNELQANCELAVSELETVASIEVANVTVSGDRASFSFYITPLEGDTEEVTINGLGI